MMRNLLSLALLLALAHAGQAQRPKQAGRTAPTSQGEVRAELAATLLNANHYAEAAAEYRRLLVAEPNNREYRLGLGRALAWGDHPREAERELLRARDPKNANVIEPLLRSVRTSFDPTAAEATVWRREAPGYLPYRLALARALAREDPRRAVVQYDTLRMAALAGSAEIPAELALIREQADAYIAFGARPSAIMLLGVALDRAPNDTSVRHTLAAALFDAGMPAASRAEYDTLIATAPTANAYVARANAALAMRDTTAAIQDLAQSISVQPNYDGYYLYGSLARSHEDFAKARVLYDGARRTAPDASSRRDVAAATAELTRAQRPVVAFAPVLASDPGWTMHTQSAADNGGVSYVSIGATRTAPLGYGFISDFDFGVRRIAQSAAVGFPAAAAAAATGTAGIGTAASLGLARQISLGHVLFGAAGNGGVVAHPGVATFGRGSLTVGGWFDAWALAVDLSREPAYESLFTPAALSLRGVETPALIAKATTFSAGGPIGILDAAGSWTRTWLSDGNASESFDAFARVPLTGGSSSHLFAVYQGNIVSYAQATRLYWDPVRYTSNAAGPELAWRHGHGLSLAVRGLAGYATDVERDTTVAFDLDQQRVVRKSALQLSTGADASYRAAWWEGAANVGYGRTRAGSYQRLSATVTLRVMR